jgi:hypothetical protein
MTRSNRHHYADPNSFTFQPQLSPPVHNRAKSEATEEEYKREGRRIAAVGDRTRVRAIRSAYEDLVETSDGSRRLRKH